MNKPAFDPSGLSALVVDPSPFERRITLEQLRLIGFGAVAGAPCTTSGWDALLEGKHDVVLIEWLEPECVALDFVRRVRHSEDSPNRNASLFMLTNRGAQEKVQSARDAGVDGYLKKPISAQAMQVRVRVGVSRPKVSVEGSFDLAAAEQRAADAVARRARAKAAAVLDHARALKSGDEHGARAVLAAALQLGRIAREVEDDALRYGAEEMARYLNGAAVDPDVVRTHAAAIVQIASLPAAQEDERARLSRSLRRMVDKKLRTSAA